MWEDKLSQEDIENTEDIIDFCQLADYTLPELLIEEDKAYQVENDAELRGQVKEYLQNQGYEITERSRLPGKSGIEHVFDILAQRNDGFTSHTVAVCITAGGDREV